MHVLALRKPDGRALRLYSRRPIDPALAAPSPSPHPVDANPHLRWHPLRGEWVGYATHRQDRTFLPPAAFNPLAVTRDPSHPTELPVGDWDVAVFDNRFPSLVPRPPLPPTSVVATAPGLGHCEVVVYTQDEQGSLGALPVDHVALILDVWAERTEMLGALPGIDYVLPFENRGAEVGVTLHHPHGQIYAYPFVPPVPARMQSLAVDYHARNRTTILADLIARELDGGERVLYRGDRAVAFVPACARYPYEVWVAPIRPAPFLHHLDGETRRDLARALVSVLRRYDALWRRPLPYLMVWYQAPTDGGAHPEAHVHVEFYPPYRTADKLKYLAGTELGAGMFTVDALPEDTARALREVVIPPIEP